MSIRRIPKVCFELMDQIAAVRNSEDSSKQKKVLLEQLRFAIVVDLHKYGIPIMATDRDVPLDRFYVYFGKKKYMFMTEEVKSLDLARFSTLGVNAESNMVLPHYLRLASHSIYIPARVDGKGVLYCAENKAGVLLVDAYVQIVLKYTETLNMLCNGIMDAKFSQDITVKDVKDLLLSVYGATDPKSDIVRVYIS